MRRNLNDCDCKALNCILHKYMDDIFWVWNFGSVPPEGGQGSGLYTPTSNWCSSHSWGGSGLLLLPSIGFLREGDNHPLTLFTSPGTLSYPYSSLNDYWLSSVPKFIALQPWFHDKNLLGAWEGFCALQIHALLSLELRLAALHFEAGKHEIDLNTLTLFQSYISTASNLIIKNRALALG